MKCPACDVELNRVTYEDNPVFHCSQCAGHLLKRIQVSAIKSMREQSSAILEQEAAKHRSGDAETPIQCPKCRSTTMKKEKIPLSRLGDEPFFIDVCRKCHMVWFNGGELAKLQLEYELSDQANEELEHQLRVAQRTDEEQQEFEEDLARLPQQASPFARAFGRVVWGVGFAALGLVLLLFPLVTSPFDVSFFYNWKFLVGLPALGVGIWLMQPWFG